MPTSCAAFGCTNNSKRDRRVTFHRFPSNLKRRTEWLKYVNRDNFFPGLHTFICSKHFEESCFDRTGQTVRLRENAVPTIFVYPDNMLEKIAHQKAAEEDLLITLSTETDKQTIPFVDHNYCLPSPEKIKKKICELERKLDIAHKKIKIYQQQERRIKRNSSEENSVSCTLNDLTGMKGSWGLH
ncbi:THAP domain-containing 2 [Pelobates cultripes]|uniref:THAP domain-containing 2 n=1 Tax=Pelobates cultripes TaxID=61616 RepID=A0AAD1R3M4_PELCU|nr:THAP domain-containing 2 [Pelobates cultripes]